MKQTKLWYTKIARVSYQLCWFLINGYTYCNLAFIDSATAQIIPDETLGAERSVVTPSEIKGIPSEVIGGGATRGANLFHSFTEFNVGEGRGVYFTNPTGVENILSRVTGNNLSRIMGTLGILGNANLFLINPNGIVFGQNARLDVGGSFLASTASSVVFENWKFTTTNPDAPPLLKINVPIGLQFGSNKSGAIANNGSLAVNPGEILSLSGSTVTSTGDLIAPGGTVQVLGQVGLLDNAQVDVSSETGGGTVFIGGDLGSFPNAARTYIGSNVTINANALNTGNGGQVIIRADEVTGFSGTINARGGSVSGNGGFVEASGKENLFFRGNVDTSAPNGLSGTLLLGSKNITIANGSNDGTDIFVGNDSDIANYLFSTPLSSINLIAPATIYESKLEGLSGDTNIILQATNDISLRNFFDNTLNLAAGKGNIIFTADADGDGIGNFVMEDTVADTIKTNGRDIAISGASLTLGNIDTTLPVGGELLATVDVDGGGAIPDTGTQGTATFTFTVPNTPENISNLDVRFSAAHTYDSDLNVSLTSPQGTELNLFSSVGGSNDNFQDTLLDDNAPQSIASGSAPFNGTFKPSGTGGLAVFNGENPVGIWSLKVTDTQSGDSGTLYKAGDAAPWGNAIGTQLLFKNPVTAIGGGITLSASKGSINVGSLNGGDITLTADKINLTNTVAGLGNLTLQPATVNQAIAIGGTDISEPQILDLTGTEINFLQNGFRSISIGRADSSGAISLAGDVTFNDPVTLRSPVGLGSINTTGFEITGADNASITLLANQAITTGNITNPARDITLTSNNGSIDTTAGQISAVSNLTETGDSKAVVTLQADQNITTGGITNTGRDIKITSTNGNIDITKFLSTSTTQSDAKPYSAGDVLIEAERGNLKISDDGVIRANSLNGAGGNISLTSGQTLSIVNDAFINSVSNLDNGIGSSQKGGDITLNAPSIFLDNGGRVTVGIVGTGQGGNLIVKADEVKLLDGSALASYTRGIGDAGDITIDTRRLFIQDTDPLLNIDADNFSNFDTGITTFVQRIPERVNFDSSDFVTGRGGNVYINAPESIEVIGNQPGAFSPKFSLETVESFINISTGITTGTIGSGNAGKLEINTGKLTVRDGAGITTASVSPALIPTIFPQVVPSLVDQLLPFPFLRDIFIAAAEKRLLNITVAGEAGSLKIGANQVELQGKGGIASSTLSSRNAGELTVNAGQVTLRDGAIIASNTLGSGKAGDLNITTNQLSILDGSLISAGTTNEGQGGSVTVTATDSVKVIGTSADGQVPSDLSTLAEAGSTGNAGDLTVETRELIVKDRGQVSASSVSTEGGDIALRKLNSLDVSTEGQITASTETGKAGNLSVDAAESVQLSGESGLTVEATNGGVAGNLAIATGEFTISDGAKVTVSSPKGQAGNVDITANSLSLNRGNITAETGTSQDEGGANITLQASNLLTLSNESLISATANGTANGGNVNIDTTFLIASPPTNSQGSDIIANAVEGDGGKININSQGIFGIEFRKRRTRFNDFTVSSEFGAAGTLQINRGIDPSRGLTQLPQNLVDPNALIAQNPCLQVAKSQFTITGRGGLPPNPRDVLRSQVVEVDWVALARDANNPAGRVQQSYPQRQESKKPVLQKQSSVNLPENEIVEAQGWVVDANGNITLVAQAPTATPHDSGFIHASCSSY